MPPTRWLNFMIVTFNKKHITIAAGVMLVSFPFIFGNKAVQVAKQFVGQEEIYQNQGFVDKAFEKRMRAVGWFTGAAWCVYFVKLVWWLAYPSLRKRFEKLFSGNSQKTWANFLFDESEHFGIFFKNPKPGDIAIWQSNEYPDRGHASLVTTSGTMNFRTIEGNTNELGQREGRWVAEKKRQINYTANTGMKLKGFIRVLKR